VVVADIFIAIQSNATIPIHHGFCEPVSLITCLRNSQGMHAVLAVFEQRCDYECIPHMVAGNLKLDVIAFWCLLTLRETHVI
jgi:hypothetical protein